MVSHIVASPLPVRLLLGHRALLKQNLMPELAAKP